jgi:hypothetical protein
LHSHRSGKQRKKLQSYEHPNRDANHLIGAAERVESLGVRVIGIGTGEEFVREIYPQAVVVSDFRQMSQELLGILGREFQIKSISNSL